MSELSELLDIYWENEWIEMAEWIEAKFGIKLYLDGEAVL